MRRLLVSLILATVVLGGLPTVSAASFVTAESPYVAQTTFGAMHDVQLDRYWLLGQGPWYHVPSGQGITVAIVDTGIDPGHPDLRGASVIWRDFVGDQDGVKRMAPYDDHGHGTHVAGIVAGGGHLQSDPTSPYWVTGVRGIAPDVDLVVAKAMDHRGRGSDATVAQAIAWAVDPDGDGDLSDGADVINLSLGIERPGDSGVGDGTAEVGQATRRAVAKAVSQGVVVVASSGNAGVGRVTEPGSLDTVITVAAADRSGEVASFSNYGPHLDVLAPGVLVSSYPQALDRRDGRVDGYVGMAGTSMAAPVVAGVVALAMEANPELARKSTSTDLTGKVLAVEETVRRYAVPVEGEPPERGAYGMVNAHGTLLAVEDGSRALNWVVVAGMGALLLLLVLHRRRARARRRTTRAQWDEWERASSD